MRRRLASSEYVGFVGTECTKNVPNQGKRLFFEQACSKSVRPSKVHTVANPRGEKSPQSCVNATPCDLASDSPDKPSGLRWSVTVWHLLSRTRGGEFVQLSESPFGGQPALIHVMANRLLVSGWKISWASVIYRN
jgi:hypothetical protein